jgi:hypothetical protein
MRCSRLGTTAFAVVLVATTACATYHPRPGPFIARMDSDYYRDGQKFSSNAFSSDGERLVAGNPRAVEHARQGNRLSHRGWGVYLLGLLTAVAGPVVGAAMPQEQAERPVTFGVIGLGAGLAYLGIYWQTKGNVALLDAVNVYNDDLEAARQAQQRAAAPGGLP